MSPCFKEVERGRERELGAKSKKERDGRFNQIHHAELETTISKFLPLGWWRLSPQRFYTAFLSSLSLSRCFIFYFVSLFFFWRESRRFWPCHFHLRWMLAHQLPSYLRVHSKHSQWCQTHNYILVGWLHWKKKELLSGVFNCHIISDS